MKYKNLSLRCKLVFPHYSTVIKAANVGNEIVFVNDKLFVNTKKKLIE